MRSMAGSDIGGLGRDPFSTACGIGEVALRGGRAHLKSHGALRLLIRARVRLLRTKITTSSDLSTYVKRRSFRVPNQDSNARQMPYRCIKVWLGSSHDLTALHEHF
jgi:hypothetical protein